MSIYIMTDIHGHYGAMRKMLEKIGFQAEDRLVCAGDYIDRGTESYEMLKWLEAPGENVVLIRGNHDQEFAYYVELLRRIFKAGNLDVEKRADLLTAYHGARQVSSYFDYYGTVGALIREKEVTFCQLARWAACIRNMPYFHEIQMHGRRCIIVHAGYIERKEFQQLQAMETEYTYDSPEEFFLKARDDAYMYGGVEHGMILAGHTPTTEWDEFPFNHGKAYRMYDEETDCVFYDLDCGYGFKEVSPEARLACLRLEDEKIFFIRE